jgi:hypothetical protein
VENLAPRSNGKVLVTLITKPEVWEIDPHMGTAHLVYEFPNASSTCGIVEYAPDQFAINVGNWSVATASPVAGSWSVWRLDLRVPRSHWRPAGAAWHLEMPVKVKDISEAIFLNGLISLPKSPTTLMASDSGAGKIYSINVDTGVYHTAITDAALQPNSSDPIKLGVNGIRMLPSDPSNIYAGNSLKRPRLVRIPIDPFSGDKAGPAETIVNDVPFATNLYAGADDFALENNGHAWITTDPSNTLYRASLTTGHIDIVAGGANSPLVAGLTSCQFGKSQVALSKGRLYIVTNGGLADPAAVGVVGGRLLSLDTDKLPF